MNGEIHDAPAGWPAIWRRLRHPALRSRAWWIAGLYAGLAFLWIYFSDQALGWLVSDPEQLVTWGRYKGFAYVLVTAVLLLLLMRRAFGALAENYAALQAHEAELQRMQRLYAALSQVNQAIVWTKERDELFGKICQALVEQGGFGMAWVGWNDPATNRLMPVVSAGDPANYINGIRVYTDERPEGSGPAGTAFRLGAARVSNDFFNDPSISPWREEIRRRGFRAAAFFPIRERQAVAGVLCVYAQVPDFFQDREIALLTEAASDVSFALDNLLTDAERRQAETAARQEKLFSDTMIDSMPGVVYFYDTQGKFLRWNRNFETVTGCTAEEIAISHPLNFFSARDRALVESRILEVFAKGESSVEADFVAKDGTATPYFFTGRRVEFSGRTCLVGVGIDISERRQAEAALHEIERRFAVVVQHLREGLVLADGTGELLHWNPAALRLLGFDDPEEGRNRLQEFGEIFQLSTLDDRAIPPADWPLARLRRGEQFDGVEIRVRRQDRDWERIFSYSGIQAGEVGARRLVFLTLTDITERKQAEMLLRSTNEFLEHRVTERTEELRAALSRAEAADRVKSAFLATMSHELRTPLNSIIGFTGIVLQGLAGPLNAEQTKQLGMVRNSARHLLDLINDVLDLSKIEAGQLQVQAEPFDLPAAIERVTALVQPMAQKKSLALAARIAPEVGTMAGDRRRVEQILLNLLSNAIKFTDQGAVTLEAAIEPGWQPDPARAAGPAVCIAVCDTGVGIKPEDLATLFQPFRQIDTGLSRQHEGTGLGLAICRRLAALMGGEIGATSVWERGSTFTVILPLQPPGTP